MTAPEQLARLEQEIGTDLGAHINDEDAAHIRFAKRLIPHAVRHPARAALTAALRPLTERKVCELVGRQPLRLNLGSGWAPIAGWINIDLAGAPVDLRWDLRRGIPFPDSTADAVF